VKVESLGRVDGVGAPVHFNRVLCVAAIVAEIARDQVPKMTFMPQGRFYQPVGAVDKRVDSRCTFEGDLV
jgi:hypothetical protein